MGENIIKVCAIWFLRALDYYAIEWLDHVGCSRQNTKLLCLFKAPLPWIEPNKSLAKLMAESHEIIAWILIAFITLHVLGALKHHFIDKDNVLKRMLPGKSK